MGIKYVAEEKQTVVGRQGGKCFAGFVISVTDLARCDTKSSQSHFSAPRVPFTRACHYDGKAGPNSHVRCRQDGAAWKISNYVYNKVILASHLMNNNSATV